MASLEPSPSTSPVAVLSSTTASGLAGAVHGPDAVLEASGAVVVDVGASLGATDAGGRLRTVELADASPVLFDLSPLQPATSTTATITNVTARRRIAAFSSTRYPRECHTGA